MARYKKNIIYIRICVKKKIVDVVYIIDTKECVIWN